jgi:hypothetical protein
MPIGDIEALRDRLGLLEAQVRLFELKLKSIDRRLGDAVQEQGTGGDVIREEE